MVQTHWQTMPRSYLRSRRWWWSNWSISQPQTIVATFLPQGRTVLPKISRSTTHVLYCERRAKLNHSRTVRRKCSGYNWAIDSPFNNLRSCRRLWKDGRSLLRLIWELMKEDALHLERNPLRVCAVFSSEGHLGFVILRGCVNLAAMHETRANLQNSIE